MPEQKSKITGYRNLNQTEIDTINTIKDTGKVLEQLTDFMQMQPDVDPRWLSIGRTDLQKGLMALVRAVAKPESF